MLAILEKPLAPRKPRYINRRRNSSPHPQPQINLLPVEVESMDKFLAGSFDESVIGTFGGESSFGLEFRNSSSGESYRYNSLSEAFIYDNPYAATEDGEDAWLSNQEVAMGLSGSDSERRLSQDIIIYETYNI